MSTGRDEGSWLFRIPRNRVCSYRRVAPVPTRWLEQYSFISNVAAVCVMTLSIVRRGLRYVAIQTADKRARKPVSLPVYSCLCCMGQWKSSSFCRWEGKPRPAAEATHNKTFFYAPCSPCQGIDNQFFKYTTAGWPFSRLVDLASDVRLVKKAPLSVLYEEGETAPRTIGSELSDVGKRTYHSLSLTRA